MDGNNFETTSKFETGLQKGFKLDKPVKSPSASKFTPKKQQGDYMGKDVNGNDIRIPSTPFSQYQTPFTNLKNMPKGPEKGVDKQTNDFINKIFGGK